MIHLYNLPPLVSEPKSYGQFVDSRKCSFLIVKCKEPKRLHFP